MTDFTRFKVVDVAGVSGSPETKRTVVTTGPARLYGVYINTVLSNHTLPIENDADESPQIAAVTVVPRAGRGGRDVQLPRHRVHEGHRRQRQRGGDG